MADVDLSEFLKRGTIVKTQLQDDLDWIPNTVVNIYKETNEIEIILDDRYKNSLILVGDAIKVTATKGEWQYIMDTWITSIRVEDTEIITLKIVVGKKINNLRKDERYSVNYGSMISRHGEQDSSFGVITNISVSGLCFITRVNFIVGEVVSISIILSSKKFIVEGEIVRTAETPKGTEYGVRFTKQDEATKTEISTIVDELKEREDRLSRIVGFN